MGFLANKIFTLLENHISFDQNLITLKKKLEELNTVKEDNESKKCVELQPRKKLKKEVEIWFQHVETINGEILKDLEKEVGGCNLLSRGFLGSNISKRIEEVEELLERGKSYDGLVIDDPQWIGQVLSTTTLFGEVAKSFMKEIWAYLMDYGVSKIGVWGMGGVGKTTVMKLIHNQLLKETKKFNVVIWITVSKEMNIAKLQNGIARAIKLSLSQDDDEIIRAGILYERLAQKGKYVLILDDLWHNLSFEEVGIPGPCNGSKLVITTRSSDVCQYLNCQIVKMPNLPKQDAWGLFLQNVGRDILNCSDILPFVKSVADQCAGLPLAIVTIARSMKGARSIHEWRNALSRLNNHAKSVNKLDEKVLQQLQFSYDRLEDETVKQCFLCCALWPEDFEIFTNKLIELWIAEGLMEDLESMQEQTDRGHAILNQLMNNCLLENTKKFGKSYVKLHDLVRDMALRITSVKPRFLVKAGMQLKKIPDLKEWSKDLDKVSLMENSGIQIPAEILPPKCQMLTTLLLSSCNIRSIPECFFEQMHGLRILDLSWNRIKSLPNSISNLEALTVLLLYKCERLENMPSFLKLQALKKLNFEGTNMKNLPHGMERLVNLEDLNLSDTFIKKAPGGILSKLSRLQRFVGFKPYERRQTFVRGDEIGGLRKLEIFKGRFCDLEELSNYAQALHGQTQGPREYYICVGGRTLDLNDEKCIGLRGCQIYRNGVKFPSNIQQLSIISCSIVEFWQEEPLFLWFSPVPHGTFSALGEIYINGCKKLKKLFSSNWVLKNLQNLVLLTVGYCDEMEEIIALESELEEEGMDTNNTIKLTLPKLRELSLGKLPKLKSIYSANGAMVCDSLQSVTIYRCPTLKRIPLHLPLLEEGRISPPPSIKKIMINPRESWENMEWDSPYAKSHLEPFVEYWDAVQRKWFPAC